jgi:hypothetical protein
MFRLTRRARHTEVRFCDSCGQVTTTRERARRQHERAVAEAHSWTRPF